MARFLIIALTVVLASSCGGSPDGSTLSGKAAILDGANIALSTGNCQAALELVEGLYASSSSDNQVRAVRASAQACAAGMDDFFGLVGNLASSRYDSVPGEGSYLWRTAAQLFYTSDLSLLDSRILAARFATDADLAQIKPGRAILSSNAYNAGTYNVSSTLPDDRTDDANFYQVFVSLAAIGDLQDRYSAPDTGTWAKTHPVGYTSSNTSGWELASQTGGDGCFYAASILNLVDSASSIQSEAKGSVKDALTVISAFGTVLDQECEKGCNGTYPTGCSLPAGSCDPCPRSLRDASSCEGSTTDKNSCAAAGIAYFIDNDPIGGWSP
jgi:hypothetical protein